MEQLAHKPYTDQKGGRNDRDPGEDENKQDQARGTPLHRVDRTSLTRTSQLFVQDFAIGDISPMIHQSKVCGISILTLATELHSYCASQIGPMLKIQRRVNGDVVFTLSGRFGAENISDLSALISAEPAGRAVVLDLKDLVLVDRDIVLLFRKMEADGIELRNCPPYIREWIAREEEF